MPDRKRPSYMPDQVNLLGICAGALFIVGAIAVAFAASFFVLHIGHGAAPPRDAMHLGKPPPIAGPTALQPFPLADIDALRGDKRRVLESYGWLDRDRGIAHIPIERAMALMARDGAQPPAVDKR